MIDINECSIGDVCWALIPAVQKAPLYGTITAVYEKENAIQLTTMMNGIRTVSSSNAFWSEKEAKEAKKK
tara:strand:- start:610 stop:819 length:210 start_codon:yes stop_codon:yes gene_type:complete